MEWEWSIQLEDGGGLMVINCDGDRSSPFGNKVTSEEFRPDF